MARRSFRTGLVAGTLALALIASGCGDSKEDSKGTDTTEPTGNSNELAKVDCGSCHKTEKAQHDESLHGRAFARGEKLAPTCKSCHDAHREKAADGSWKIK